MAAGATEKSDLPLPNSEYDFTWSDFEWIAEFMRVQAGIVLAESKVNLVYSRLAKRLRAVGLRSFHDYCQMVAAEGNASERQAMIAAITTNVTRFFREPHHFEYMKNQVLPPLIARARTGGRIRIWSAGCSTGEEPYSIAMTVLDSMPDANERDVLILATDIDHIVLGKAKAATYGSSQVEDIPDHLRGRALCRERSDDGFVYRIAEPVHSLIRFRELNLLDRWPMKSQFDAIFCRNVMIYFDEATQTEMCERFADILAPGGCLFIGHSERVLPDNRMLELVAQTTYRRKVAP